MKTLYKGIAAILPEGSAPDASLLADDASGKFVAVQPDGPCDSLEAQADRVVDGRGLLMIPGLVNAHTHLPMIAMRGYAGDMNLQDWLFNYIFPVEARLDGETVYAAAQLAIAESLACGVTSVTDMYLLENAVAKACVESGIKANLAKSWESDDVLPDGRIEKTRLADFASDWHGADGGRIKVDAMIHAEYTTEPETWEKVAKLCLERGLLIHTHISETESEHEQAKSRHGGLTPARAMAQRGVFESRVEAAHCVWLDDEDVELFKRSGASVLHCPVSNLKLASGIAPIERYLREGINVAIGTDGASSNNSLDMLGETKLAAILQKGSLREPTVLPASVALGMATVNGARAQGRELETGRLAAGFDADFAILELGSVGMFPCFDPASAVVYSATPRDVIKTAVRGKMLYDRGEFPTIDVERARASVKAHALPRLYPGMDIKYV